MLGSTDYHEDKCSAAYAEYMKARRDRDNALTATSAAYDPRIQHTGDVWRAAVRAYNLAYPQKS